jgi:DNA-binding transcriptional regulator YdaS (Cro superfamily)
MLHILIATRICEMKTPKEVVTKLGGTVQTAAALGVSPQAVSNWLRRGTIPLIHAHRIVSVARDNQADISYQDLME